MSKTGKYWLVAFFYAMLFIVVYGYTFNTSDQEEHLPQVYQLLHPSLYPGDYVVHDLVANFGIRYFYVRVVYLLALAMPVPTVCFVLQVMLLCIFCFYLMRLTSLFYKSDAAAYVAPLLCLIMLNRTTVGGNSISDSLLTCSVFANAACMPALYYFFAGRRFLPYGLAGLATLFQLLMGLHIFMLLVATQFITTPNKRGMVYAGRGLLVYLLVSLPMLGPVFYRQMIAGDTPTELFYYVLYVFRNPHHYLPSFFETNDYIKSMLLLVLAGLTILLVNPRFRKMMVVFMGSIIVGMCLYYFIFEVLWVEPLGKLQWFKTSVWLTLFCGIALSGWMVRLKYLHRYVVNKFTHWLALGGGLVMLLCILNTAELPMAILQRNYQIGDAPESDLTQMHVWIKNSLPENTLVISFPMDESFLCEAQRPMPIAWKAIIHEPWFLTRWYTDFVNCYALNEGILWERRDMKSLAQVRYNTFNNHDYLKHRGVQYRLDDMQQCKLNGLGKVVHVQGNYMLTEVE